MIDEPEKFKNSKELGEIVDIIIGKLEEYDLTINEVIVIAKLLSFYLERDLNKSLDGFYDENYICKECERKMMGETGSDEITN